LIPSLWNKYLLDFRQKPVRKKKYQY